MFFLALMMGAATFNLFYSFLAGVLMAGSLFVFALWTTKRDPQMLRICCPHPDSKTGTTRPPPTTARDHTFRVPTITRPIFRAPSAPSRLFGAFLIGGEPVRMDIQRLSADVFAALKVTPVIGRVFNNDEDRTGGVGRVVVLSYGAWQQRFGGMAPTKVGRAGWSR